MKIHSWTLDGPYLLNTVKDIANHLSKEEMAEESSYALVADFKKA